MSFDAHKNFAFSSVLQAPTPAVSGTSLKVLSGEGALLPAAPFNLSVSPANQTPTPLTAEIVRVTAINGDTLTIVRAQEGTPARAIKVGDRVVAAITAKTITDIEVAPLTGKTLWVDSVNGIDATGLRGYLGRPFLTISAAKTAAQSGDLIKVGPGLYHENNLGKAGVRYDFAAGAKIEYNEPGVGAGYGIFDDRAAGAAGEWQIDGFLEIIYRFGPPNGDGTFFLGSPTPRNFNALGAFVVTNVGTSVRARLSKIGICDPVATDKAGAICVTNCAPSFFSLDHIYDTRENWFNPNTEDGAESSGNGVYWQKGELHVECRRTEMFHGYCTWGDDPDGADTNFYFNGQLMKGSSAPVYVTGKNTNYRVWINAELIQSGGLALSLIGQARVYVTAQKISGVGTVISSSATELWVNAEKLSTTVQWLYMEDTGGHSGDIHLNVQHYECTGSISTGFNNTSSATLFIHGGLFKGTATDANCLICHGNANGKTRLMGCIFDNSANSIIPLTVTQNGLTVMNCAIICGAGATASISGTAGKVVKLFGTNVSNKATSVITTQVNALTVDANVV